MKGCAKTKRSPIGGLFVLAGIEGMRKRVQAARDETNSALLVRLAFRAKRGGVQSPSAPAKKKSRARKQAAFLFVLFIFHYSSFIIHLSHATFLMKNE